MRILVTNDDGINAPGLAVLEAIAAEVAGPDGEVWTVAPAFEQSGVGHKISYTAPMIITEFGPRRWAAEGAPADCVLAGIHQIMADAPPDLILSGVNRGNNAGENTLYSGTIGAAIEGALQGHRAIALSQFYGPRNKDLDDPFEASAAYGAALVKDLLDKGNWDVSEGYHTFYNVNFPPVPAADVKGRRVVSQGVRGGAPFATQPFQSPNGRTYLWITGGNQHTPTAPGTDVAANLDGYISITPMRCDLTIHTLIEELRQTLE